MFWPHWKYEEYCEDNSTADETADIVDPPEEPVDPHFANVVASFFPMSDWMAWYDLTLDPHAFKIYLHRFTVERKDYLKRLRAQFPPLAGSFAGKALLAEIGRAGARTARFVPNWNWGDPLNADTRPRGNVNADDDFVNSTARGKHVRVKGRRRRTTGRGTDSLIRYTPQMWGPGGGSKSKADGDAPDVIIFHELVHAARQMHGLQEFKDVNKGYGFVEEYLATVLTNIYMSERKLKGLLGEHGDKLLDHPEKFLDNYQHIDMSPRELMAKFKTAQPDFYRALSVIPAARAPFNPVQQYETEQRAGQALGATMFGG